MSFRDTRFFQAVFAGKAAMWSAVFTGILTVYTVLMYQVTRDSSESTERSQRAIVSIGGVTNPFRKILSGDGSRWESIRVGFFVRNGGPTPPRDLHVKINYQAFTGELPQNFTFPDQDDRAAKAMFLGPQTSEASYVTIPVSTFINAIEEKKRVYFWGWATYRDVFRGTPTRLTEFCVEAINIVMANPAIPAIPENRATNTPARPGVPEQIVTQASQLRTNTNMRFDIEACETHNCYDEDCPDYQNRVARANYY